MKDKSARDVISRVRRLNTLIDINHSNDVEKSLFLLSQEKKFKEISVSVKSQLRRTVTLYYEYISKQDRDLKLLGISEENESIVMDIKEEY